MLLSFDISSGGISAALFTLQLERVRLAEHRWNLETDERGAATLSAGAIEAQFKHVVGQLKLTPGEHIDALSMGCFMHNCVLVDAADEPVTPVFTWLDRRGDPGIQYVRSRLGDRFHELTGCHYHPMFPIFKLASMAPGKVERVVSVKAFLLHRLTGRWVEDHGIASSLGLFNVRTGRWDAELLALAGLSEAGLAPVASRNALVGEITPAAGAAFGLTPGIPVANGSGDGFLANVGSDAEAPSRLCVTLGTSAVVRQTLARPVLDAKLGTFCYRADESTYLFGCAGSNGGNVLDWGREIFGTLKDEGASTDPPILLPLLNGERSPDWDPELKGSWHGLTSKHRAVDLSRSILEGVLFNVAHFIDIIKAGSSDRVSDLILSGNGFLQPLAAPILATATGLPTWMPAEPGLASLRGAAVCALRALGRVVPALDSAPVPALRDTKISRRYREYRRLRGK